jgi:hypothetical protein
MGFYSKIETLSHTIIQFKMMVVAFSFVTALLAYGLVTLSLKEPLLIERGCITEAIKAGESGKRTEGEVQSFIREAASQRIDSDKDATVLLSEDEKKQKISEQVELKKRNLAQRLIVETISMNVPSGNEATLHGVRLFSIGELRSAVRVLLILKIATVPRSELNPWGLLLVSSKDQISSTGSSNPSIPPSASQDSGTGSGK